MHRQAPGTRGSILVFWHLLFDDDDVIIPAQGTEVFQSGGEMRPLGLLAGSAQHCSLADVAHVLQFEQRENRVRMDIKIRDEL